MSDDNKSIARKALNKYREGTKKDGARDIRAFSLGQKIVLVVVFLAVYTITLFIYYFFKTVTSPLSQDRTFRFFELSLDMIKTHIFFFVVLLIISGAIAYLVASIVDVSKTIHTRGGLEISDSGLYGSAHEMTRDDLEETFILRDIDEPKGIIVGIYEEGNT